ncbi:MAG: translation initiation factor IF-2, partial [Segatella copri]
MSIRLNKALRELNIGLQTAVEFLENKKELGEVKAEPSFKISDEQYQALNDAFSKDKEVRDQAEKLFTKKTKDKKRAPEQKNNRSENVLESGRQQYKPLGKIDLDSLGKKSAVQSVADKPEVHEQETAAVSPAPNKEIVKAENKDEKRQQNVSQHKQNMKQENQQKTQQAKSHESKGLQNGHNQQKAAHHKGDNQPSKVDNKTQQDQTAVALGGSSVFTLKSEKKMSSNEPKVLGKIDLSSLNQSTRPKKKSKEERRKEREEKLAQQHSERKKRVRINKERVDINAEAKNNNGDGGNGQNRGNNGGNKKNRNKNRNNNNNNNKGNNNNRGNQRQIEVDDEAVARQVKETLARLTSKSQNKKGAKYRKEKREAVQEKLQDQARQEQKESKTLKLTEFVTVSELATMMDISVTQVISTLMGVGIMVSINQRLDAETINMVAEEFGFKTEYVSAEVQEAVSEEEDDENDLVPRAPIVTVMGHVDHGKTSLLDYIRNTNVIAGEAGGITQHIGAYSVTLNSGRKVTFLDTPGHEAFTAMRARGAQATDIAIIIIAADDSVMPTTKEAIAHAQAAGVPMVFAINKIDKPGANPDRIREDLANMNLLVEEWGGKYQCQEISAKKGIGVHDLLDKVLLEADMLDLKANPNRRATGTIIESSLDKGRGYVSTVLVANGTLKVGDIVLAGTSWGRVKAMFNERNANIKSAAPAEPAIILGLNGAPTAGDQFHVIETEQEAREIA